MVRGLGGGSLLEKRSGKGGVATQGEGDQKGKGKAPESGSPFPFVA